jgi:hypothetical protein
LLAKIQQSATHKLRQQSALAYTHKTQHQLPQNKKKRETAVPLSVLEAGIEAQQHSLQARADTLKRRPLVEQSISIYPRNRLISEYRVLLLELFSRAEGEACVVILGYLRACLLKYNNLQHTNCVSSQPSHTLFPPPNALNRTANHTHKNKKERNPQVSLFPYSKPGLKRSNIRCKLARIP